MSVWTRVLPKLRDRSLAIDLAMSILGAIGLVLFTQVRIPVPGTPVLITLQVLGVLLLGGVLGPRVGALAVLEYLTMGACGLPVFMGGGSGVPFALITGGFLLSFLPATILFGWMAQHLNQTTYRLKLVGLCTAGLVTVALIYGCGWAWMAWPFGLGAAKAFTLGVQPFILLDVAKVAVAAAALAAGTRKEA